MKIDLFYELAKLFKENNFSLYLVGGSVRDYLLYDEFDDMDVVTDAKMQDLKSFLNFKSIFENVGSGVIIYKGHEIDITTLRKEDNYLDYRHPDLIEYVNTPLEEYKRRDLTINALYLDIDGKILDYTTGKEDLDNRIIKIIGNPQIRFNEDPLRILRCLRFSFNLKFELDKKLEEAIFLQKHLLKKLNYQKITSELLKFKCSPDEVRLFLSKYRIDEVIPLYFENTKKQIFDLHCDTITKLYDEKQNFVKNYFQLDLNKMQKGSYLGQVFAVFVNMKKHDNPYEYVKNVINYYHEVIKENNNIIEEAYTYEDLIRIKNASKFIAFLSVEELGILEGDITRLDELYNLGVRMMTLTWNYKNCIGHPNIDLENENINLFHYEEELGLTEFGKKVIKRMNELGIIIDVSHLSDKGVEDVLKISSKPICASHSSSRILNKCARNLSEELLVKLNEKEALIGVNYCYDFVHINNLSYVNSIIEHFKNYKETINIESIAFGSDFDGIEVYEELKDCSKMNTILSELKNIFSKKAMQKICYNNFFELVKKNQA